MNVRWRLRNLPGLIPPLLAAGKFIEYSVPDDHPRKAGVGHEYITCRAGKEIKEKYTAVC